MPVHVFRKRLRFLFCITAIASLTLSTTTLFTTLLAQAPETTPPAATQPAATQPAATQPPEDEAAAATEPPVDDPSAADVPEDTPVTTPAPRSPVVLPKINPTYDPPLTIAPELATRSKRSELERNVTRIIGGQSSFDQATLSQYYDSFLFKAFSDPNYYDDIAKFRRDLMTDLRNAKTPQVHDAIVAMALKDAGVLCTRNFPPPTRVNAMMVIAELNQIERPPTGAGIAVPLPSALPYMLEQLKSPTQIDGVRIVALSGILRHVETQWFMMGTPNAKLPISDDVLKQINAEMLAIASAEVPPEGRNADAHAWLRSRAVDVLGSLIGQVPDAKVYETLIAIVAKKENPIWLRARAAFALGRVDYAKLPGAATLKHEENARHLAGLLADACKMEIDRLQEEKKKAAQTSSFGSMMPTIDGGGGALDADTEGTSSSDSGISGAFGGGMPSMMPGPMGMGGMGGMGPMGGMGGGGSGLQGVPKFVVEGSRRRLLYELSCARAAIHGPSKDADFKGLVGAAKDPQAKDRIKKIDEVISKLITLADPRDPRTKEPEKDKTNLASFTKDLRKNWQILEDMRPKIQTSDETSEIPEADIPEATETPAAPADNPNPSATTEPAPAGAPAADAAP